MAEGSIVRLPGSQSPALPEATAAGVLDTSQHAEVTVIVRRRAGLPEEIVAGPTVLTSEELAERYGADPADVDLVRRELIGQGLEVTAVHPVTRRIKAAGTLADLSSAFGTTLTQVTSPDYLGRQVTHPYREGPLYVPAALDGVVLAVLGLDTWPQARPDARPHAGAKATSYLPNQVADIYGFPAGTTGAGQTIAVIELGGGFTTSDLDTYFSGLGITPTPSVTAASVDGASNAPGSDPSGADGQVNLDIDIIGAVAPGAAQVVYFAPAEDRGFVDAISDAVEASPAPIAISISWGQSEDSWTAQGLSAMNAAMSDAAALGITVCAAAGDNGSTDGVSDGQQHVVFPASSPYALGCGGTKLLADPATGTIRSEVVWSRTASSGGATGGGVSNRFALPSWQANAGVPARAGQNSAGRGVPDVAGNADPATGYQVYSGGRAQVVGGTSAVAPLWSALIARLAQATGQRFGLIQPMLYAGVTPGVGVPGFRDITSGNNGAYSAGPGWDACSGLGVANGQSLLSRLADSLVAPYESGPPPPELAVTDEAAGVIADRLPPVGEPLVGREDELKRLISILGRAGRRGRSRPPIVVVVGEAGIGKTALAVHAARRIGERFPHGALFIALGGPSRPDTMTALRAALQDLEAELPNQAGPPGNLASLDQLTVRYRNAFSGRRILVLVDDAREPSDVEPFIPPNPSSALVVTSKSRLSLPNAEFLSLSPLTSDEVAVRLRQTLGTRGFELSDELLQQVMAVTQGNPLAVLLTDSALREAPPARVVLRLEAEQRAFEEASSLEAAGIPEEVLERYNTLVPEARHVFHLLGVLPDPDFEEGLAAAVLDVDESAVGARLEPLIEAELIGHSGNGRYSLSASARDAARYWLGVAEPPSEQPVAAIRAVTWLIRHSENDLVGAEQRDGARTTVRRAGYASDTVPDEVEDRLGMEREVEALSWVVAAKDVDPPLSVGLFGDWGTGKSYFMRLMENCVGQIAATAREEHEAKRDFPACSYVRQITFNAWHYVDANLWASLVTHIFEELARPETPEAEREVANLLDRLQTTQVLRKEAEDKKAAAEEERQRRTDELERVKRRRIAQVKDLRRGQVDPQDLLLDRDVRVQAAALAEKTPSDARHDAREKAEADLPDCMRMIARDPQFLREIVDLIPDEETRSRLLLLIDNTAIQAGFSMLADDPAAVEQLARLVDDPEFPEKAVALIPDEQQREQVAALAVQVTQIYTDVAALTQVAADIRTIWGKLGYSWKALWDWELWRQKEFSVPAAIVAVGVGLSAYLISQGWTLQGLLAVLVSAGACLRLAVSLIGGPVARVRAAMDAMDETARRQIASLEAQEAQLQHEVEEARRLEFEAERELEDIRRGRRLYQYIQERASSTDYRQYLGVIALIRKDFERLAELMDEARKARLRQPQGAGSGVTAAGSMEADEEQRLEDLPQIDRVILYIDDLDRCPAKRVVEVLEAVHLLLALKLFVVVVGVDSRWLVRSLQRHYRAQLSPEEDTAPKSQDDSAYWDTTPQNYLEKIFQIVFSIRSMGRNEYESLLDALFPDAELAPVNGKKAAENANRIVTEAERTPGPAAAVAQAEDAQDGPVQPAESTSGSLADISGPSASREGTQPMSAVPNSAATSAQPEAETPPVLTPAEAAIGDRGLPMVDADPLKEAQTIESEEHGAAGEGRAARVPQSQNPATLPRDALQITSQELKFMKKLVPFVPTPRSAKRLANTYRLMRVLITTDEAESFLPGHDDTGHYKIGLTLLAILIGFPNQASVMFRQLLKTEDTTWPAFKARLAADHVETHHADTDGQAELTRPENNNKATSPVRRKAPHELEEGQSDDDAEAWERLLQYLSKLTEEAELPMELSPYQYWCRRVARFSFQTGRLETMMRMENEGTTRAS